MPHETQTNNVKDVYQQIHLKLNQITNLSFPNSLEEYFAKIDKKGMTKKKDVLILHNESKNILSENIS